MKITYERQPFSKKEIEKIKEASKDITDWVKSGDIIPEREEWTPTPPTHKFDLPKKHFDFSSIFFVVAMILGGFFWLYIFFLLVRFIINLIFGL